MTPSVVALLLGAVSLTSQPAFIEARPGQKAELLIEVGSPDAKLELSSNVGQVSAPTPAGPGRFQATLTAPKERYPQVAIVSAQVTTASGIETAYLVVPIHGVDTLKLNTKPL